ncbi:MAG: hypothetical protein KDK08_12520 [Rhizobiaceae bacterium]|nr:hypothetical protein [Rhizobiaceae bacterium]
MAGLLGLSLGSVFALADDHEACGIPGGCDHVGGLGAGHTGLLGDQAGAVVVQRSYEVGYGLVSFSALM